MKKYKFTREQESFWKEKFKDDKNFGGGLTRPSVIETYSPLYKGYRSLMIYQTIKKRNLPDEVFTQNYMSRLGNLRK